MKCESCGVSNHTVKKREEYNGWVCPSCFDIWAFFSEYIITD